MLIPKKSLGQNFLLNKHYLDRISDYCVANPELGIIEIGPGTCNLTRYILQKTFQYVWAIEIDPRAQPYLEEIKEKHANFEYIITDALLYKYPEDVMVCGNLPYNVGSRIVLNCCKNKVYNMAFLLQAEVTDRICAQPGTKEYGSLSVLMQIFYEVRKGVLVPPDAFYPPPKIYSRVVLCKRKTTDLSFDIASALLREAFQFPRKTLENNLPLFLLEEAKINPKLRPGALTVEQYISLIKLRQEGYV